MTVRRCSCSFDMRLLLTGLLAALLLHPARAQKSEAAGSAQHLWAEFKASPSTTRGKNAGRRALRRWASAPRLGRLKRAAASLPSGSSLWPDLVDALEDAYRVADGLPDHRDEYGAILKDLKHRVTHAEGWLKVMIALGDYHRNVRGDKWAGIRAYEEAFVQGGSQRLIGTIEQRLARYRPLAIGSRAPTFEVTTRADSSIDLASYRGDPVLLYFWARWCSPCRWTLPKLTAMRDAHRDADLHLLGLITEVVNRQKLSAYIDKEALDWPQAVTDDSTGRKRSVERLYGLEGPGPPSALGHMVLIDRRGRIAAQGYDLEAIQDTLRTVLAR